jgi:hypothetical protein
MADQSGFFAGDEDQPQTACEPTGQPAGPAIFSPLPKQQKGEGAGVPAPPMLPAPPETPSAFQRLMAGEPATEPTQPPGKG